MRPQSRAAFLVALALALCARRATADDILEKAAVFDPTIHFGDVGALTIAPLLQTRWTAVETGGPRWAF